MCLKMMFTGRMARGSVGARQNITAYLALRLTGCQGLNDGVSSSGLGGVPGAPRMPDRAGSLVLSPAAPGGRRRPEAPRLGPASGRAHGVSTPAGADPDRDVMLERPRPGALSAAARRNQANIAYPSGISSRPRTTGMQLADASTSLELV